MVLAEAFFSSRPCYVVWFVGEETLQFNLRSALNNQVNITIYISFCFQILFLVPRRNKFWPYWCFFCADSILWWGSPWWIRYGILCILHLIHYVLEVLIQTICTSKDSHGINHMFWWHAKGKNENCQNGTDHKR